MFYTELERRIREWPGVEYVTTAFSQPFGLYFGGYAVYPATNAIRDGKKIWSSGANSVTPDYFAALRIPIVRGRRFTWDDDKPSRRVAIPNEAMAERFWPGEDPIGKKIEIPESDSGPWEVIGVARDAKYAAVFEPRMSYIYLPQMQDSSMLRTVFIRSSRSFEDISAAFEREVHALEPDLPIADLRPFARGIASNLGFVLFSVGAIQAAATVVLGLLAAAALLACDIPARRATRIDPIVVLRHE